MVKVCAPALHNVLLSAPCAQGGPAALKEPSAAARSTSFKPKPWASILYPTHNLDPTNPLLLLPFAPLAPVALKTTNSGPCPNPYPLLTLSLTPTYQPYPMHLPAYGHSLTCRDHACRPPVARVDGPAVEARQRALQSPWPSCGSLAAAVAAAAFVAVIGGGGWPSSLPDPYGAVVAAADHTLAVRRRLEADGPDG